jgi:hypothetical protein
MKTKRYVILSGVSRSPESSKGKDLAMAERDERIGCEVLRFAQNDKRRKW